MRVCLCGAASLASSFTNHFFLRWLTVAVDDLSARWCDCDFVMWSEMNWVAADITIEDHLLSKCHCCFLTIKYSQLYISISKLLKHVPKLSHKGVVRTITTQHNNSFVALRTRYSVCVFDMISPSRRDLCLIAGTFVVGIYIIDPIIIALPESNHLSGSSLYCCLISPATRYTAVWSKSSNKS